MYSLCKTFWHLTSTVTSFDYRDSIGKIRNGWNFIRKFYEKYWTNFLTHCISHTLLFLRRRTLYTTRYEKYRDFFVPIRWQRKFFILEKRRVYDPERKAESSTVCMKVARCLETATKQEYDLHRGSLPGSLIDTKLEYGAQTERLPT